MRNAVNRGTALGLAGLFGGLGPAIAAPIAGILIVSAGWRAAFIVPGTVILATAVVFHALVRLGHIVETKQDRRPEAPATRREMGRAFVVLALTILCTGLIYNATQAALPKFFSERLGDLTSGIVGVSLMVSAVYAVSAVLQVVAGYLADRFPLRIVYVVALLMQAPVLLVVAANLGGAALLAAVAAMVTFNVGAVPAENALVARYAPSRLARLRLRAQVHHRLRRRRDRRFVGRRALRPDGWLHLAIRDVGCGGRACRRHGPIAAGRAAARGPPAPPSEAVEGDPKMETGIVIEGIDHVVLIVADIEATCDF